MALNVYSTRFLAAAGLNVNTGYTVPAGYRAVLREVDIFIETPSAAKGFSIQGVTGAVIWYVFQATGNIESYQWQGRQVFDEGDIMTFSPQGGAIDVTASGYLLTLP